MGMRRGTILIVDDEQAQRETLAGFLRGAGHRVHVAAGGEQALDLVGREAIDLVITDLRMPGLSGLDLLERVREQQPSVAVVVVTAYGTVANAVAAMKAGAADYLTKPIDLDELELVVGRVLERIELIRENARLRRRLEEARGSFRLLGRSPALQEVLAKAARAADTDATVLIRGESGTGKELLARSIHDLSPRAERPFLAVNCAALPETLLESELFGHEKGAFTGAHSRHAGRVAQAEGGTLFLDEIGDVSAAVQVKLLRFLQEKEYTPVGGEQTHAADVRIVAATHRDLEARIAAGAFRDDLYYRLNVVGLTLPPLRARRQDIPELAEHFLVRYAKRYDRGVTGLTREAMDALIKYGYPGNVRELENIIEQAIVLSAGEAIARDDLPEGVAGAAAGAWGSEQTPALGASGFEETPAAGASGTTDAAPAGCPDQVGGDLPAFLDRVERRIVLEALRRHGGNQSSAARQLGLTESGLRYKLKRWRDPQAERGS